MASTTTPVSDIFISYSRADNNPIEGQDFGWVDLLKQRLEAEDRKHGKGDLKIFLDKTDLEAMHTWPHELRKRLRQSKILLACISPNFLRSFYCRQEWDYYHRVHNRFSDFDGVASVYFVDVSKDSDPITVTWRDRIGKTQHVSFMPWFAEGRGAIERGDFQPTIEAMYQQFKKRLEEARLREWVPGNLEASNEFFVGREDKLDELRDSVEAGEQGRMALISGFGGMGKSSLAVEYANRAKGMHQCGVWRLNAEGYTDPLALLGDQLFSDPYLNIPDTEQNRALRANPVKAGELVLAELKKRIQTDLPTHRERANVLLLFDNVTDPAFLSDGHLSHLPLSEHIRYIATSRLTNRAWGLTGSRVNLVDLDRLDQDAALELLKGRQRDMLDFASDAERAAATDIVTNLLDGFTLAIEQVAVFMAGQTPISNGPKTFAEMNRSLRERGVVSIDTWMERNRAKHDGVIRHREQCLSIILDGFVLPQLDAMAQQALRYAVCMPATHIPLNWLKVLSEASLPDAAQPEDDFDSPWDDAYNLLTENRLLDEKRGYADTDATQRPLATLHQVIREHLAKRYTDELPAQRTHLLAAITAYVNTVRGAGEAPGEADLQDAITLLASLLQDVPAAMGPSVVVVDYLFTQSVTRAVVLPIAFGMMQRLGAYFREQLAQDNSNTDWQRNLSVSLSKLGDFYLRLGDVEQARLHYTETLTINRDLVKQDGSNTDWQRNLSVSLSKLGDFYLRLGDVEQAQLHYGESSDVLRKLVKQDGSNTDWQRNLSVSLSKLGDFYLRLGDVEQARLHYGEDIVISRKLVKQDSSNTDWQRELSVSLSKLGDFYLRLGDVEQARLHYGEALTIRRDLVKQDGSNTDWQRNLSVSLGKLGDFYLRLGDVDQAQLHYDEDIVISRKLVKQDSSNTDWQRELSVSLGKLGDFYLRLGDVEQARLHYTETLTINRDLVKQDGSNTDWQRDLSVILSKLGDFYLRLGDVEQARLHYTETLTINRDLVKQDGSNTDWQRDLSVILSKLGDFYLRLGDVEQARLHYGEDIVISRKLVKQDSSNTDWQRELSVSLGKLGDFYFGQGEAQQAYDHYQEALGVSAQLVSTDQTNTDWLFTYAYVLVRLGDLFVAVRDNEEARSHYEQALAVLNHLLGIDSTSELWQSWHTHVQKQLTTVATQ